MKLNLSDLEAKARKATSGPYRVGYPSFRCTMDHGIETHGKGKCVYKYDGWNDDSEFSDYALHVVSKDIFKEGSVQAPYTVAGNFDYDAGGLESVDDAAYLAALSPEVVLALIELAVAAKDHVDINSLGSYANLVDCISNFSFAPTDAKKE